MRATGSQRDHSFGSLTVLNIVFVALNLVKAVLHPDGNYENSFFASSHIKNQCSKLVRRYGRIQIFKLTLDT